MAFPIITADQRLAENRRSSGVILGPAGVGKTTLLKTTEDVYKRQIIGRRSP